jgi:adiponectin receptor
MYALLGACLFAPVAHGWTGFGPKLYETMELPSFLGLAVVNFSGAALYASRIPER